MLNRWLTAIGVTATALAACRDVGAGDDGGAPVQCSPAVNTDTCNPGDVTACVGTLDGGDSGTFADLQTCLDDGSGYGHCCE
jgi:hypothetical protein